MREPKQTKTKKNARYPNGVKYTGAVQHRGVQRWVPGSFGTKGAWQDEARRVIREIDAELDGPERPAMRTIGEFAGVTVRNGRGRDRVVPRDDVRVIWPWTHRISHTRKRELKESSCKRHAEALRPFVRRFEDRPLDSFTKAEARTLAAEFGAHTIEALSRLWGDAIRDDLLPMGGNVWAGQTIKREPRIERPDFEIVPPELMERIIAGSLLAHPDDYRYVVHGVVTFEHQLGLRPSEIFGVEHDYVDLENNRIFIRYQINPDGSLGTLKNWHKRPIPLFPESKAAYLAMPRLNDRWAFPTPRGTPMTNSRFHKYWAATRAAAGLTGRWADLEFYELKHRAITWMVTPPHWKVRELGNQGGIGIDLPTAALIVGHTDGGKTIAKHYLHLEHNLAIERALQAYAEASRPPDGPPQLRVVGE